MSSYEEVIELAEKISNEYSLCDNCLGRLFSKTLHLSSNKRLGKKLHKIILGNNNNQCYICKNFFSNVSNFLNLMIESSSDYSFSTFSVGIIIKHSIIDRDDVIRSKYKLKIDSIKTDIVKELGKLFSRKTGKTIFCKNSKSSKKNIVQINY